jgi:hypothetical protein
MKHKQRRKGGDLLSNVLASGPAKNLMSGLADGKGKDLLAGLADGKGKDLLAGLADGKGKDLLAGLADGKGKDLLAGLANPNPPVEAPAKIQVESLANTPAQALANTPAVIAETIAAPGATLMMTTPVTQTKSTKSAAPTSPTAPSAVTGKCTLLDLNSNTEGISAAFIPVYKLIFFAIFFMYALLLKNAISDIKSYVFNEGEQTYAAEDKPHIYISDTTDYNIINYPKNSDNVDEPYHVHSCQNLIKYIRTASKVLAYLVAIHIGIYFTMYFYKQMQGEPMEETIGFDTDFLKIIITVTIIWIGCKLMSDHYNNDFINGLQTQNKRMQSTFDGVGTYIKDQLPLDDRPFFENLVSGNQDAIAQEIAGFVKSDVKEGNLDKIRKRLFTSDLYNYFATYVPVTDPLHNKVQVLFSPDGASSVNDCIGYFYYKGITSIPTTAWPSIRDKVEEYYTKSKTSDMPDFTYVESQLLAHDHTAEFNSLYMERLHPSNLSLNKDAFWKYITKFAFIAIVFIVLVIGMNYDCLEPLSTDVFAIVQVFAKAIWEFIKSKFTKKDAAKKA